MYTIKKTFELSAAHRLNLSYNSKCEALHGHNWTITVECRTRELNREGMVADFAHVQEQVKELLDHRNLNEILPFNPTAEHIAAWICERIPTCYRVSVQESAGNVAAYEKDED